MGDELLVRNEDVVAEDVDGQLLLLPRGGTDVVHLDAVGAHAWALLAEACSADTLASRLAVLYDVDAARVRRDLEPLLEVLLAQGLVRAQA